MKYKLAAFDLDGTLVRHQEETYWKFQSSWAKVHPHLGVTSDEQMKNYYRYHSGEISRDEWMEWISKRWRENNATKEKLLKFLEGYEFTKGTLETLEELKKKGIKIAIVSNAVDVFVEEVAAKINADYVYAIAKLIFDDAGRFVEIKTDTEFLEAKVKYLDSLCESEGIKWDEIIAVGDSHEDVPMYKKAGLSFAFDPPTEEAKQGAGHIIHDMRDILKYIDG